MNTAPREIRVYNTLTKRKEPLAPIEPGVIKLYACGVTTYDECHLGHAMQAITFDMVVRWLRFRGYQVVYVRNFTDVDDKIIERASKLGIEPLALSSQMIAREQQDMDGLGIARPTHAPKVSDFIPRIIRFVEGLIAKGAAYATSKGNVYYRVRAKQDYGKLSGRKVDELRAGVRKDLEDDKDDPLDFALWKSEDVPGAAWDSSWGKGRPGWHIECSVMGYEILGPRFDVHGGGLDLIFPHHENEVAQSESFVGGPHVNTWIHNGLLTVNKEKMSKSLGNFFTIRAALQRFGAELVRFTQLQYHYRSNADFSIAAMANNATRLAGAYEHLLKLDELRVKAGVAEETAEDSAAALPKELRDKAVALATQVETAFGAAMDDDFNAPNAIVALQDGVRGMEELLRNKKVSEQDRARAGHVAWTRMKPLAAVLGLFQHEPREFFADLKRRFLEKSGVTEAWIRQKMVQRQAARDAKNFQQSDALRDELLGKGVELRDRPAEAGGTDWMVSREALERTFG